MKYLIIYQDGNSKKIESDLEPNVLACIHRKCNPICWVKVFNKDGCVYSDCEFEASFVETEWLK